MNGNQSGPGTSGSFDLFANPFHILGVEPAASIQRLQSAFDRAAAKQPVSSDALAIARDIALDPQRRLPHELGYPETHALFARLGTCIDSGSQRDRDLSWFQKALAIPFARRQSRLFRRNSRG